MDDHLGIAPRGEGVSALLKIGHQLLEIIDLAVEDDTDGLRRIGHGLSAALQVDDGQTAMRQTEAGLKMAAFPIRAAMGNAVAHGSQTTRINRPPPAQVHYAGKPTHS